MSQFPATNIPSHSLVDHASGSSWARTLAVTACAMAAFIGLSACTTDNANKPAAPAATSASNNLTGLPAAIAGSWRSAEDKARDPARHPLETLNFFQIKSNQIVVEITPGAGWYSAILAPFLAQGGGTYVVATADPAKMSDRGRANFDAYKARFGDTAVFGTWQFSKFGSDEDGACPAGSADVVLTFRNVHNWLSAGWAEKAFADFYKCLKPGGVLGVVEHRASESVPFDPKAESGYVRTSFVTQLATKAGFVLEASSEINANPKDTKDHPFGVWTLPPVSRSSPFGAPNNPAFDRTQYDAIGESDRMTLRFRKPK